MKELIKKLLRERVLSEDLIEENYATNQEMEKLATEILTHWTKIWQRNDEVDFDFEVYIRDAVNPYKYEILSDFIQKTRINVEFSTALAKGTKGQFRHRVTNNTHGSILLGVDDYELKYIKNKIAEYNANDENSDQDFYFLTYWCTNKFETTLVHELTHAYDNWRSNGNFANDQNKLSYALRQYKVNQIEKKKPDELGDNDYKTVAAHQKAYLRLDHEINARFTQAVREMRVTETDWDSENMDDLLKPWPTYYKEFKQSFYGWNLMNTKIKKNLIRRLAKVYKDSADEFLNKQNNS